MEIDNPYRSPRGDELDDIAPQNKAERPVYDTRWQAARVGMRRGAMPGMIVVTVVFGLLVTGLLMGYCVGWLPRSTFPESWLSFGFQAVIIVFSGGFFYGAISGGIIMSLTEILRFQKHNNPSRNSEPEKKLKRPVFATRWQATWAGVRRGPVLGMVVATVLTACSLVVMPLLLIFLMMTTKAESMFSSPERFFTFVMLMPIHIGGLLAMWFFTAIECAILAGIMMGLIEAIRFRKPK